MESQALLKSVDYQKAKSALLQSLQASSAKLSGVRPPASGEMREAFLKQVAEYGKARGRDLYYPIIASGLGSGPFFELMDGSVMYDMITGIGINFFGHSHPELMSEMLDGIGADVMQGNLQPGHEAKALLDKLLSIVGPKSRLKHGWITTCGTMANEIALKCVRQKRAPATKILAFKDCFAGRSTAMQEITDNPAYRQGQPVYGEVYYLSFYDEKLGLEGSIAQTLSQLKEHLGRFPGKFAALMAELVQGEGGFNFAPREFYAKVFEEAKKAGLAIWVDEIQTFGRTGEYFAYQKFGLDEYVDIVTLAKMLQSAAVLYSDEYNPKPGLVAGTFSGSTVALRAARRSLELLEEGKYLGENGKVARLSERFATNLTKLAQGACKGLLKSHRNIGGMIAFESLDGTLDDAKLVLSKLFERGVVAFYCGHGPYLVRMLPPLGVMSEKQVDEVCEIIGAAIQAASEAKRAAK